MKSFSTHSRKNLVVLNTIINGKLQTLFSVFFFFSESGRLYTGYIQLSLFKYECYTANVCKNVILPCTFTKIIASLDFISAVHIWSISCIISSLIHSSRELYVKLPTPVASWLSWLERRTGNARSRVQTPLKYWIFQASLRNWKSSLRNWKSCVHKLISYPHFIYHSLFSNSP